MKFLFAVTTIVAYLAREAASFGVGCGTDYGKHPEAIHFPEHLDDVPMRPQPNLKIAYVGDVGILPAGKAVQRMIANFDPALTVHVGDFDYLNLPQTWMGQINREIGPDKRYVVNVGNHELLRWGGSSGYQALFQQRHVLTNMTQYCFGDLGVLEACLFDGVLIMLVGAGTRGSGHAAFIDDVFRRYPAQYKVCTWHKNQRLMQIAGKGDQVGWDVYETCVAHGAMVVNGHSHTYSRTYAMSSFERQIITNTDQGSSIGNPIVLEPGQSFLFVTGLGGMPFYSAEADRDKNPWWAAATTDNIDPNADYGATLCTYNLNGTDVSYCQQVGRRGHQFDEFFFTSHLDDKAASLLTPSEVLQKSRKKSTSTRVESQLGGDIASNAFYVSEACDTERSDADPSDTLTVGPDRPVVIQFPDMKLTRDVSFAQLQVYSASVSDDKLPEFPITVAVRVVNVKESRQVRCNSATADAGSDEGTFKWVIDDYEAQEVWATPDFSDILQHILSDVPSFVDLSSKMVQLVLSSGSEYEFHRSECLAPTLAIDFAR